MLQVQCCMRIKLTIVCKDATATAYTSTVLHWAFSAILHVLPVVQCTCVSCVLHHTEWGSSLDVIGEWDYSGILTTTVLHGPCCAVRKHSSMHAVFIVYFMTCPCLLFSFWDLFLGPCNALCFVSCT